MTLFYCAIAIVIYSCETTGSAGVNNKGIAEEALIKR